jgi:hypothetical protein
MRADGVGDLARRAFEVGFRAGRALAGAKTRVGSMDRYGRRFRNGTVLSWSPPTPPMPWAQHLLACCNAFYPKPTGGSDRNRPGALCRRNLTFSILSEPYIFTASPLEVSWRSSFDEVEYFPVSPPRQLFDGRPDPARPDQLVVKPIGNDYLIIFRWRYWRVMPRRKDVAHAQSRMAANPGIFDRDGFRIVSIAYYSLVNPLPNFAADASWMIEGAQDRKTIAGLPFTRH